MFSLFGVAQLASRERLRILRLCGGSAVLMRRLPALFGDGELLALKL